MGARQRSGFASGARGLSTFWEVRENAEISGLFVVAKCSLCALARGYLPASVSTEGDFAFARGLSLAMVSAFETEQHLRFFSCENGSSTFDHCLIHPLLCRAQGFPLLESARVQVS